MAGTGPARKPDDQRARRNADPMGFAMKVVAAAPVEQPKLPTFDVQVTVDGELESQTFAWPERTRAWWKMWADSPLSNDFTSTDWDYLLDTARLHAAYWNGDLKLAPELRLRAAKFGATPEDRARLRIVFAVADEAEAPKPEKKSAGGRYAGLRSVGGAETA